jgi:hypothetical protein
MKISVQILIPLYCLILLSCNLPSRNSNSESGPVSDSVTAEADKTDSQLQQAGDTAAKSSMKTPDFNQLIGAWLRTDGGKTIRINGATPDGKLDTEYFNPKPIHVGRAEWLVKNNSLVVIVELQDVNYPGSRYTLEYFPLEDELVGVYYQAVDKESYDVGFVRQK